MSVSDYNEITPRELNLHIKAYNEQLEYESKERITMAYLIAGWGRAKKMPDLYKILESTNRIPKDQTDEQLFKTIRQINAAMGGKEVKREAGE